PLLAIGPQDLRAARRRAGGRDPCTWARARAGAHRDVREVREPRLPRVLARDPPPRGRRSHRCPGPAHLAEMPMVYPAVPRGHPNGLRVVRMALRPDGAVPGRT